jgi:hydrogenase nickel incorporation protein HypB
LKYPPMFQAADVVVVSKTDLAAACGYERETALANIRRVAPKARVFEISAKSGAGMAALREFLVQEHRERSARGPLGAG